MNLSTVRAVTAATLTFASLAALPWRASAQLTSGPAHRLLASRAELQQRLSELRASTQRGAEISYVQGRLEAGDFRAGDRIELRVEDPLPVSSAGTAAKSPEQQLTDTFTVSGTQELTLPLLGSVPLRGVLRSELQQYLTARIATRIREPAVHARPLIGVAVTGGVLKPGYYAVPPDAGVGAVITAAGGGNKDAKITDVKIVHDGNTIWKGQALQRAIAAGSTLDDLRVQPGDEIVVGQRGSATDVLRTAAVILSIPVAILSISRFSH